MRLNTLIYTALQLFFKCNMLHILHDFMSTYWVCSRFLAPLNEYVWITLLCGFVSVSLPWVVAKLCKIWQIFEEGLVISWLKFVVVTEANLGIGEKAVWWQLASWSARLLSRVVDLNNITSGVKCAGLSSALLEWDLSSRSASPCKISPVSQGLHMANNYKSVLIPSLWTACHTLFVKRITGFIWQRVMGLCKR